MSSLPRWAIPPPSAPAPPPNRDRQQPVSRNKRRPPARPQAYSFQNDETVATARPQFGRSQRDTRTPRRIPGLAAPAHVVLPAGYESWQSILVITRGLPPFTTPLDIRDNFCSYGNIVYIEVDEDRPNGPRTARFRFEPPPKDITPFRGPYEITINRAKYTAWSEYTRSMADAKFKTPLGNPCPVSAVIKPAKLTFGVLTEPAKVSTMESVKSERFKESEFPLSFTVDFGKRKIFVAFPVCFGTDSLSEYRVDIKFDAIKDVQRLDLERGCIAIVVTLLYPPPIWKKRANVRSTFEEGQMAWSSRDLWQRCVHIGPTSDALFSLPVSLDDQSQVIDLGRWTTYCFELEKSTISAWTEIEAHLRDWNIKTTADRSLSMMAKGKRAPIWTILSDNISCKALGEELALIEEARIHPSLRFDVRYQLEVCISHGIFSEYSIGHDFIEKLIELSRPERIDPDRGRLVLEYAADQGKRIWRPMELFSDPAAMAYFPTTMIIPDYCAMMRKVIVTPTRLYFKTPTVETTNRVIRQFRHVQDNFIRVQFTDELLEGAVKGCEGTTNDQIYRKVYRVLEHGVQMGPWRWKFLAYGNSQIREHGAFFFCEPEAHGSGPQVSVADIRKWMGSFNHINTVGKYAARMGQCFSTTRLVPGIMAPRIVKIADVEHNGFCFTDGVGKMSPLLAEMIARDWDLDEVPSAIQFRMGGCKGVLVTWPDVKGTEVHVRKSQEKFEAVFNGLEVIKCSQFSCATLNRQTISILSSHGVPDHVFQDMLTDQVSGYNEAMTDKELAIKLLGQSIDENQMTLTIAKMLLNGFMETREPFVQTLLQLWRTWSIKALKEKARLTVNKGAFVLGCVDETGTLKGHDKRTEGQTEIDLQKLPQIFLTVPKAPEVHDVRNYKVITGLCVVGRNPSLHPGDIRVVNAVDVPALHHLKPGVVAFPNNGDRDIPSMCSGGDLDGDDFFVIWDQNLVPREWCYPPMNFQAPTPPQEDGKRSMDELMPLHFILYMKKNNLPLIASAHLATADREFEGVKHPKCLRLAELHSTAVDYVKTTVPAGWSRALEPRKWPHFMEKLPRNSYPSRSVLGKLYDMVQGEKLELKANYELPFDSRILNKFDLTDDILKKARQIKTKYDISMRRIMGQLEISSEIEVWSTFVLSRPRVGSAYKLQEKVGRESDALKRHFRDLCIQEAGGSREYNILAPFVAAMYRITWEELKIAVLEARQPIIGPDGTVKPRTITARSMPLISFPWLFDTVLGNIVTGGDPTIRTHVHLNQQGSKHKTPKSRTQISCLKEQTEDLMMGITRTDDGQVIHRGEILHLFPHDGEEEVVGGRVNKFEAPEKIAPPVSENGDGLGLWDLDPRLSVGSISGDDVRNVGEAEVIRAVSTPVMKPRTSGHVDESEELISLDTPSPKKRITSTVTESVAATKKTQESEPHGGTDIDVRSSLEDEVPRPSSIPRTPRSEEGGASEDDTRTLVEVEECPPVVNDPRSPLVSMFEKLELSPRLLPLPPSLAPSPALPKALVSYPAGNNKVVPNGNVNTPFADDEPEGGYEEVIIELEEESAVERLARVLGE